MILGVATLGILPLSPLGDSWSTIDLLPVSALGDTSVTRMAPKGMAKKIWGKKPATSTQGSGASGSGASGSGASGSGASGSSYKDLQVMKKPGSRALPSDDENAEPSHYMDTVKRRKFEALYDEIPEEQQKLFEKV